MQGSRKKCEVLTLSDDDTELAMIRRKKMAKLVKQEKEMKASREHQDKQEAERSQLLRRFLASDAHSYLEALKKSNLAIGARVEEIILYLIVYRGLRQTITQLDIRYVERQVKGEGPKIRIQRDGVTSDFGSYVRDAIKKDRETDSG